MTEANDQRPRPADGTPIRVMLTKVGLDPHDRGIKILAAGLEDAGMEVIYTGPWQSKAAVVSAAVQEDPQVLGFNAYSGDHLIIPKVLDRLAEYDVLEETLVLVGGNVPEDDHKSLHDAGVTKIFPQNASVADVVDFIRRELGAPGG